jgi:DnaD/phage-associated family protein
MTYKGNERLINMSAILLNTSRERGVTLVPNCFIDEYMPVASGSYVKVYLYLLRCVHSFGDVSITISSIADHLDETEKDIIRALCYWEKVNLIHLERDSKKEIISMTLNDPESKESEINNENTYNQGYREGEPNATYATPAYPASSALDASMEDTYSKNSINENISEGAAYTNSNYDNTPYEGSPAEETAYADMSTARISGDRKAHMFEKPTYSEAQIKQLTENDEVKWLLNIIEIYLDRLIKPMDMQLILYLYESLGFSAELIMYLYEYCISKNKKNPSYIEAVALSWAEEGVDTVEKAEAKTALYNSNYTAINKAFGLNRAPGQIEKQFIEKWLNKFGFSIDIIIEACNRTILLTQKPDFKYADKILENWNKKGVKELSQISKLDEEHSKDKAANAAKVSAIAANNAGKSAQPRPAAPNRFNAFPQRSYTEADYSSMEQKLLQKKMN